MSERIQHKLDELNVVYSCKVRASRCSENLLTTCNTGYGERWIAIGVVSILIKMTLGMIIYATHHAFYPFVCFACTGIFLHT